jgi:hypothetical protein
MASKHVSNYNFDILDGQSLHHSVYFERGYISPAIALSFLLKQGDCFMVFYC